MVLEECRIEERAVIEEHLLVERVADPLHGATHLLGLDQTRVERLADVGDD